METYRKNHKIQTQSEAEALLAAADDFINNPAPGKTSPNLDEHLRQIWNQGDHLDWQWSDETQTEYDARIAREQAEAAQLAFYQDPANIEDWKDVKLRIWRNQMLVLWIDETFIKPLFYALTPRQETERIKKRQELLDWPATFIEWVDDAAIDAAKPSAPSWIV